MERISCPRCGREIELLLEKLAVSLDCPKCERGYVPLEQVPENDFREEVIDYQIYTFRTQEVYAIGYFCENDEFAVVRGSKFSCYQDDDLSSLYAALRTELIESDILVLDADGHHYTLTESYCFDDHHTAASLVAGQDEDGDLAWDVIEGEDEDEDEDEDEEDEGEYGDGVECDQDSTESSEGVHFLDFSREQIRQLIVEVLEQRPNNSVKKDELVAEILRHIGIRTSGWPRLQFTSQVMLEVQWLSRQKVLKRYRVKNNRVRLTDFYRSQFVLASNLSVTAPQTGSVIEADEEGDPNETIESLRAENVRLRRIIAMLALEGVTEKDRVFPTR